MGLHLYICLVFFGLARFKPGTQDHKDCANWFHLWAVAAVIIGSLK